SNKKNSVSDKGKDYFSKPDIVPDKSETTDNKKDAVSAKQVPVHDKIESTKSPFDKDFVSKDSVSSKMSEAQIKAVSNLSKRRGISEEQLEAISQELFGIGTDQLSSKDASVFIRHLQSAA
ncbi:MAG: hypothetical protein HQK93_02250, partial [Nitrospirae bacterium]|nr:hypothetical protein [Nitrospirota bacterium]